MIPPRLQRLFDFIDYLHFNKDVFRKFNTTCDEIMDLSEKQRNINPDEYHEDKLQYEKLQTEKENLFKEIDRFVLTPLNIKANQLDIWTLNSPIVAEFQNEVHSLKKQFNLEEIKQIRSYIEKYIDYRKDTKTDYLNQSRFSTLDKTVKALFDYFKENRIEKFVFVHHYREKPIQPSRKLQKEKTRLNQSQSTDADEEVKQNNFSVLEWATIFYYAETTKILPESKNRITSMECFIETHNIPTTLGSFKSKFYNARKRINIKLDYPVPKLEKITPFLKENYKETVTAVDNDKQYLEEHKIDSQDFMF